MARDWHELFKTWAKPPSETEETKGSQAAKMINDAVRDTGVLAGRTFKVYPSGSYPNRTNIRLGSDVDVAIVLHDAFFYTLPAGYRAEDFGIGGPAAYGLDAFRGEIGRALATKFGSDLTPGNKTFDIAGNSYRLPADATPFLLHREYTGLRNPDGSWHYHEGVETRARNAPHRPIINWHSEHYNQGVARNQATNRRFKRMARILKRLRDDMCLQGAPTARARAEPIASFLLECIAYNANDTCYNRTDGTYFEDVKSVIADAWRRTKDDVQAAGMTEVSGRKQLFGAHQGWTREQAHSFLLLAWQHVGFQ